MLKEGIVPDGPVFVLTLKACTTLLEKEVAQLEMVRFVSLEIGRALHADCKKLGFASDIIVAASLLSMYGNCGAITDAEAVFVELPQRSAFICGSMMSALIEIGQSEKAIQLYKHASVDNVLLDDALFSCLLRACSDTGNLEVCREVHFNITSTGLHRSLNLANSLAHTYGSCSSMVDGQLVAEEVLQPDVVTWSACIANFVQGGNLTCLEVLSSMQDEGIEPGATTFLSVLTFCSHAGLRNEGLYYLLSMSKDYGIVLNSKHFLVLTDLLGRAGDFKRIENFLGVSSMINNVSIWLVLLAACSRQGNTELGGHAFKRIMELQPKEAAAYVLMANTSTETSEVEESYVIWQSDVRYLLLGCIRRGAWLYAKALSLQLCLLCATLSKRTIMCYSFANVQ
ncbi:hypothetical protein L7F22_021745 [Adiantum nelumboides]|nr:hypothetical protein [Adiantum nelumboides]